MTKSKIGLAFISLILILRLAYGQSGGVDVGTLVRLNIPTVDYAEYTDNQTVVRRGEWEARISGYTDFIPGDVVIVEGEVREGGRVIVEPSENDVIVITRGDTGKLDIGLVDRILIGISQLRHLVVGRLQKMLPEPHASLAVGVLLGVKKNMSRDFYDQLVQTGTLHIVAASGYNVTVVAGAIIGVFGYILPRYVAIGVSLVGVWAYVVLAGAGPAIVRAGIMGSLSLIGLMFGRMREAKWLLWTTAWLMLMLKPTLIRDVGFQLSISATFGILYFGEPLNKLTNQIVKLRVREFVANYVAPTFAASLATAPVIWWHFGRVSGTGLIVNMLILPVVPYIMLLAALCVVVSPFSYLLYVPLWWVVSIIRIFGAKI